MKPTRIRSYQTYLLGTAEVTVPPYQASIHLLNKKGRGIGVILFVEEGDSRCVDGYWAEGIVRMCLPISRLSTVLDLLRNEDPIYIRFYEVNKRAYLSTSKEPIGEGELPKQARLLAPQDAVESP